MRKFFVLLWQAADSRNWRYYLQGKWRQYVRRQYAKIFEGDYLGKAMEMARRCPDCYDAKECVHCHCSFEEMALSDKKCKNLEDGKV